MTNGGTCSNKKMKAHPVYLYECIMKQMKFKRGVGVGEGCNRTLVERLLMKAGSEELVWN